MDPDDPFRNFKLFLYAFKAKQDADTIRENTMRGRRQRASVGMIPNGNVPWPFDYDTRDAVGDQGTGLPSLNRERAEWVRKWADWLLVEKTSLRTLGRRMEDAGVLSPRGSTKWSPATIRRILSNRGLLGEFYAYRSGDEPVLVHSDEKLAILSVEEFQVVQNILSENRSLSIRNTKRDYTPLHGFVWCHCGRKTAVSPRKGVGYFRCNVCRDRTVKAQILWQDAKAQLSNILTRPDQVLPALLERVKSETNKEGHEERRLAIQAELKNLDSALERTIRMFAILDGFGEDKVRDEVDRIKRRRQTLESDLEQVERSLAVDDQTKLSVGRIHEVCARLGGVLQNIGCDEWKGLLREFNFRGILQKRPATRDEPGYDRGVLAIVCVATFVNAGSPGEISTSTSTTNPSRPMTAQDLALASMRRGLPPGVCPAYTKSDSGMSQSGQRVGVGH